MWLSLRHFVWSKQDSEKKNTTLHSFCIDFAHELIYNPFIDVAEVEKDGVRKVGRKKARVEMMHNDHQLMTCPKYASKFLRGN